MLVPFADLLAHAQAGGYALGYFEAWDIYSLEAVVEAAEAENSPVILGFGGIMMDDCWFDGGGLERLGALGVATAQEARVPVALILNEVATLAQVERGIKAGFNAVMLDSSDLGFVDNVRVTQRVLAMARPAGVGVEAEIGQLPDASDTLHRLRSTAAGSARGQLTDPEEAARFVEATGVDALSVSVGNVHVMTQGKADIDWERLTAIHKRTSLPLVIHGGTGFPEEGMAQAIALGVAKFNFGTVLKQSFLDGVAAAIADLAPDAGIQEVMGSRKAADVLQQGKTRMKAEVTYRIRLLHP
jgi:ketose-bisphosphate aldolase